MIHGLMKYPVAESTGRATEGIDSIIASNRAEEARSIGTIGPNPEYDEEGNIIPITGYPPDIALSPFVTSKGLIGLLKEARKTGDVTKVYRGIQNWMRGDMVKKSGWKGESIPGDKFYSGLGRGSGQLPGSGWGRVPETTLWTSTNPAIAHGYAVASGEGGKSLLRAGQGKLIPRVMEFDVPNQYLKYMDDMLVRTNAAGEDAIGFYQGLPKQFLTKITPTDRSIHKSVHRNLGRINKNWKLGKYRAETYGPSADDIKRARTDRRKMLRWKKGVEKGTKGWRDMPFITGPVKPNVEKLIRKLYPDEYFSPRNMETQAVYSSLKIGSKKGRDKLIKEARKLMKEYRNE
jgi:hypothetical protein